ncbi:unnamed protein product [Allacma fusca]|uniref:Uncharacterized protein n=1 Tax=Allacma fusca TaxID=39272 RepID=A0A8J2KTU3_9HEXA|nr:unnamed protein product [Allacma fusca]
MTPPTLTVAGPSTELSGPGPGGGNNKKDVQQDRKDLERFAKFFTLKCVQVIVQSRIFENWIVGGETEMNICEVKLEAKIKCVHL